MSRVFTKVVATPALSVQTPRHFLAIKDLSPLELSNLVRNASRVRQQYVYGGLGKFKHRISLNERCVSLLFSKRSTRTRVSTEAAVKLLGGHSIFLGKEDIQLGVNESLDDTAKILSGMSACIVARVHDHSEIVRLAEAATVPIINALSTNHHPLQIIADFQTMHEAVGSPQPSDPTTTTDPLGLRGLKIAWVGDSNNVLFDLASACLKTGVQISVATPRGYEIPDGMRSLIKSCADGPEDEELLLETNVPEEALKDADFVFTDTWISMGFEEETRKRLGDFEGFQVTRELAERAGAKPDWNFMHCLPRHKEEVSDEVFYGKESLVFQEAQNRVWAAFASLEAFVIHKGAPIAPVPYGPITIPEDAPRWPLFHESAFILNKPRNRRA